MQTVAIHAVKQLKNWVNSVLFVDLLLKVDSKYSFADIFTFVFYNYDTISLLNYNKIQIKPNMLV